MPLFTGFYTSQVVVWDFFHQQYVWKPYFFGWINKAVNGFRPWWLMGPGMEVPKASDFRKSLGDGSSFVSLVLWLRGEVSQCPIQPTISLMKIKDTGFLLAFLFKNDSRLPLWIWWFGKANLTFLFKFVFSIDLYFQDLISRINATSCLELSNV